MPSPASPPDSAHRYRIAVTDDMIDGNGHVNNVVYVMWMQDAAIDHANMSGGTREVKRVGAHWVATTHHIEYRSEALSGDRVEVVTWIHEMRRVRCERHYEIRREDDGAVLARGWSHWALLDDETNRPRAIPEAVAACFVSES